MHPPDGQFLFGRVIRTDALGPMHALLIYVYRDRALEKDPPDSLSPSRLLIPPTFTNRRGWTHGVFETVERRPLEPDDVLPQHCFFADGRYYDEDCRPLETRSEPCGVGGLGSYEMLDDQISNALGIPRAPE
jgi:Immunity protein 26